MEHDFKGSYEAVGAAAVNELAAATRHGLALQAVAGKVLDRLADHLEELTDSNNHSNHE